MLLLKNLLFHINFNLKHLIPTFTYYKEILFSVHLKYPYKNIPHKMPYLHENSTSYDHYILLQTVYWKITYTANDFTF